MTFFLQALLTCVLVGVGSNAVQAQTRPPAVVVAQLPSLAEPQAQNAEAQAPSAELTHKPVPGQLSSGFGVRPDPIRSRRRRRRKRNRPHKGLDFVANRGTLVHAAGAGTVVKSGWAGGYGRLVIIDHGQGLHTRYAHLSGFKVRRGQRLPAGAVLGTVGSSGRSTGPHLHFEVRKNGVAVPPEDVVRFKLPPCSKRARHCKRPPPRNT